MSGAKSGNDVAVFTAAPGFRSAQPGLQNLLDSLPATKGSRTPTDAGLPASPSGEARTLRRARSPVGVPLRFCPWDSRIPRCGVGPGCAEQAPDVAGVSRRRRPRLQRAPRTPVMVPADMMSDTARVQWRRNLRPRAPHLAPRQPSSLGRRPLTKSERPALLHARRLLSRIVASTMTIMLIYRYFSEAPVLFAVAA